MNEKRVKRPKSIRRILFYSFLLLSSAVLGILTLSFSMIQYLSLKEESTRDMNSVCRTVAANLEQTMQKMDTIILNVIAAGDMKDEFTAYLTAEKAVEKNRLRQHLGSSLSALKGLDFSIRQLNLYHVEAGGFGAGDYNGVMTKSVSELPWYEETKALEGKKYINAPAEDAWLSRHAELPEDTLYVGLSRMFYDDMHIPLGFVEVKQYYDETFQKTILPALDLGGEVAVYDTNGRQIYPADEVFPYVDHRGETEVMNDWTGKRQMLSFHDDAEDGLTVVVAMDTSRFMAPVYASLIWTLVFAVVLFVLCAVAAASFSYLLSDPLRRIYSFLSVPKGEYDRLVLKDTGIREVDKLRDSLNESIRARETTTKNMVSLREQEQQVEMLELQSRMNPHFLYNSLSTIGEMADAGMTEEAVAMTEDITAILQYVSSGREQRIRAEEEMKVVERYLSCMKRRYKNDLVWRFSIKYEFRDVMIPKLCLQLLVENAVKYVTMGDPPWEIVIEADVRDEDWTITVLDNGPGFDPKIEMDLRKTMDEILETGTLPALKIEGMGILNFFIRIYLLEGAPFVFDFGNREEGGAFVTVGGHIRDEV